MSHKKLLLTIVILCGVNYVFSQEWQYQLELGDLSNTEYSFGDVQELSDGNLISTAILYTKQSIGDRYSMSPAVFSFSKDGDLLSRNDFFIPGYCTVFIHIYLKKIIVSTCFRRIVLSIHLIVLIII